MPRHAGVPPARAVRAVQHRGDRHDRIARSIRWRITRRSRDAAGRAASSPRIGPIRSSIRSSRASRPTCESSATLTRRGHVTWHGYLAAHRDAPRLLQVDGRDLDRPRPSDGADRRSRRRPMPAAVRQGRWRATFTEDEAEPFRAPDADRDGADERRRRAGDADPSGLASATTTRRCSRDFGRDKGADIPTRTDYVRALQAAARPLGNERDLTIILFTLDETALLARAGAARRALSGAEARAAVVVPRQPRGHAALPRADHRDRRLLQHRRLQRRHPRVLSIPARHDVARRVDCRFLAELVREHRLGEDEALELARELAYGLAKKAYKL